MVTTSNAQVLEINDCTQGVDYLLVVTGATQSLSLGFKHLGSAATNIHPDVANITGSTIVKRFICPSPTMALMWAGQPTATYGVSVIPITAPVY
jgi:hypothetical protein